MVWWESVLFVHDFSEVFHLNDVMVRTSCMYRYCRATLVFSGLFCPSIHFCGFDLNLDLQIDQERSHENVTMYERDTAACFLIITERNADQSCQDVKTLMSDKVLDLSGKRNLLQTS